MSQSSLEDYLSAYMPRSGIPSYVLNCLPTVQGTDYMLSNPQNSLLNVTIFNGSSIIQTQTMTGVPVILDAETVDVMFWYALTKLTPQVIGTLILAILFGKKHNRPVRCRH